MSELTFKRICNTAQLGLLHRTKMLCPYASLCHDKNECSCTLMHFSAKQLNKLETNLY